MATHTDLGRLGESLAVGYLLENHYIILERNWRFQKAEIDIIAKKDAQIIIQSGDADLVAIARGYLNDPRWIWKAAIDFDFNIPIPPQYQRGHW